MSDIECPLVSIVLPIYNVETYLNRCINSVVNQTYENIEVILVDDGSKDSCPSICDDWTLRDSRIKVIHKENAGLGMARNTGIEKATGRYICFFDSDDYIRKDTVEQIVGRVVETRADLVVFGFASVSAQGEVEREVVPRTPKKTYRGKEVLDWFLPNLIGSDQKTGGKYGLWLSAWCVCYSTSLIARAGWRFASERELISEDVYSLLELYGHVESVSVLSEPLYRYCMNPASLTHVYRPDRITMLGRFYDACVRLCNRCGYSDEVRRRVAQPYISFMIAAMKQAAANGGLEGYRDIRRALGSEEMSHALANIDMNEQPCARKLLLELARLRLTPLVWALSRVKK